MTLNEIIARARFEIVPESIKPDFNYYTEYANTESGRIWFVEYDNNLNEAWLLLSDFPVDQCLRIQASLPLIPQQAARLICELWCDLKGVSIDE